MPVPSPPLLDNFLRTEDPLSGGGNWNALLAPTLPAMTCAIATGATCPASSGSTGSGAWWTRFTCVDASVVWESNFGGDPYLALARIQNPGTADVRAYYVTAGNGDVHLGEIGIIRNANDLKIGVALTTGTLPTTYSSGDQMALVIIGNDLQAWWRRPLGTVAQQRFNLICSISDFEITGPGFTGIGGLQTANAGRMRNFYARSLDSAMTLQSPAFTEGLR